MEIERKFIVNKELLPDLTNLKVFEIQQGYLSQSPEFRIRSKKSSLASKYYLTIKSEGTLEREETEIELSLDQFEELSKCVISNLIIKKRYILPVALEEFGLSSYKTEEFTQLTAEIDIFEGVYEGLSLVEVEFPSKEMALEMSPLAWFGEDVTSDKSFKNKSLAFR